MIQLLEISYKTVTEMMRKHFLDCSKKYFIKYIKSTNTEQFPIPKFKVKLNTRYAGAYVPNRNEFVVNADFAQDDIDLKAIMYHETIHYFDIKINGFSPVLFRINGGHGDFFWEYAKKINSGEGNIVTLNTHMMATKSEKSVKDFYVYIAKKDDEYSLFWSAKFNKNLLADLERVTKPRGYEPPIYFKTNKIIFKDAPRMNPSSKKIAMGVLSPDDKYYKKLVKELP